MLFERHHGVSTTQINAKAPPAASRLGGEKWLQQSRQRREIASLDQNLARAGEFGHDAFTADHAAKETSRGFSQSVLCGPFPRDQMARIDDVALARLQRLAVNRAERRNQKETLSLDHQDEQAFTGKK